MRRARRFGKRLRRNRYRRRSQSYRSTLLAILDATGERRLELPHATVSLRAGPPAVVVTDEKALVDRFWRTETKRSVDKAALMEAMRDGEVIEGAMISNGQPILTVRST